jgi:hypothetical protein
MYNAKLRNILGLICWFCVALVINVFAIIPMYLREKKQAKEGGFEIEKDDIAFYSFAILMGSGIQGALIQWVCSL